MSLVLHSRLFGLGLYVNSVDQRGLAAAAGLVVGMRIKTINGQPTGFIGCYLVSTY